MTATSTGNVPPRTRGRTLIARFVVIAIMALLTLPLQAAEVVVFAAASLADALQEIGTAYEQRTGDQVRFNFGASSLLARQIEEGAGADLFFSADEAKMDLLNRKGLIDLETRKSRLANSLVVVVSREHPVQLGSARDLLGPGIRRLALAEPATVPAGIYAREYLIRQKLWEELQPKVIPTENVRAALAAVESGNANAAIVYQTDAGISKKVLVALEIPAAEGPRITFPVALLKDSRNPTAARAFLGELNGQAAGEIFRKFGFVVLE